MNSGKSVRRHAASHGVEGCSGELIYGKVEFMRVSVLYTAVGILWGLLLAFAAAMTVMALGAGLSWLYLFGDDPWPGWSGKAIVASGFVAGLGVFAAVVVFGHRYGRAVTETTRNSPRMAAQARKLGYGLLAVAVFSGGAIATAGFYRSSEQASQRAELAAGTERFAALLAKRHRITGVDIDWPNDGGGFSAIIRMEGARAGAYRLVWRVRDGGFNHALVEKSHDLTLDAGAQAMQVDFPAGELIEAYRVKALGTEHVDVLIEEAFRLEAELVPRLGEGELAAIPEHERFNLSKNESTLTHKSTHEFPVRFFLRQGKPAWN